ncbi:hypothetical protein [Achromobacter dolens]|uniref:hypothetical protein n=1 Tax=Achromobacter dolens TaxID=1287738 RepID=UPI0011A096C1|nr:hypothetical protein [Achromobacter dolens]
MRQKQPMYKNSLVDQIVKAVESSRWDYRTAEGIAKDVHATASDVRKAIAERPDIFRVSVMKKEDGSPLYTTKSRVSGTKDYISAFKAISSVSFE